LFYGILQKSGIINTKYPIINAKYPLLLLCLFFSVPFFLPFIFFFKRDDHIIPVGRKITDGWEKTLEEVESDDVQDALERDLEGLKFAFVYYASYAPKKHKGKAIGRTTTHLVMDEWLNALEASKILNISGKTSKQDENDIGTLTMQRAQECFVAANSHSARLQRKNSSEQEERSFRQMEFLEFLEALVHVASRLRTDGTLAQNLDYITEKFMENVRKKSNHNEYQRAKNLMATVDFGLDNLPHA
jgi:hypothetical protein